jgi:CHAD domain-containing protein
LHSYLKFKLPVGYNQERLIRESADTSYSTNEEQSITERFTIFDTFDWRLFNNSLALYARGSDLVLHHLSENTMIEGAHIRSQPVFIWDFPDSRLKELLAPIIKVRALLKRAEIVSHSTSYRVLNPDQKTVARFDHEEFRLKPDIVSAHLTLKQVRGYPGYFRTLVNQFNDMGFPTIGEEDVYLEILEAVNQKPGDYSTKLKIQLNPNMRADDATKIVLRFLLKIIKCNEEGIKADLDTEFLHDFRVAIRRTRSALSQIKSVFPEDTTVRFRREFAALGKLSNSLRDLDVYLLNERSYKAMLPSALRADIEPLFDHLRAKRSEALKGVVSNLNSKQLLRTLRDWEAFLNEPSKNSPSALNAAVPIINLAQKRIYKKYRNVVKLGRLILQNTRDDLLHQLRIECKKLRYLMEFFSSLFPYPKISILISQFKNLQDNLGNLQDVCVQDEYLQTITDELPITDAKSKRTILAIGSLIGTLSRKKQTARASFFKIFTDFASASNRELFRALFASEKSEVVE